MLIPLLNSFLLSTITFCLAPFQVLREMNSLLHTENSLQLFLILHFIHSLTFPRGKCNNPIPLTPYFAIFLLTQLLWRPILQYSFQPNCFDALSCNLPITPMSSLMLCDVIAFRFPYAIYLRVTWYLSMSLQTTFPSSNIFRLIIPWLGLLFLIRSIIL